MAVLDQGNIDGEVAAPLYELLGAIERINDEELTAHIGDASGGSLFFGHDRDQGGEAGQIGQDDGFGGRVGQGHRRGIGLHRHIKGRIIDVPDRLACRMGADHQTLKQGCAVDRGQVSGLVSGHDRGSSCAFFLGTYPARFNLSLFGFGSAPRPDSC